MSRQKAKTASGSPMKRAGNFAGSGSSPTQTSESAACQRARRRAMKPGATPAPAAAISGPPSLQRLEAQPVRLRALGAEPALLVFLVLAVVALEELDVAVALEGEDVGRDAVEEPAV